MMINWAGIATRLGYPTEVAMWQDLYTNRRLAISTLATQFNVSHTTIRDTLRRVGIIVRSRGGPNRLPDPRWPTDDDLLLAVAEFGAVKVAENLGISYSAVYKRSRRLKEMKDNAQADNG